VIGRLSKIALLGGVALYLALVVFNNVADYGSNHAFVQHVLAMDTTFPGNAGMWRALRAPALVHAFYASIILWEVVACGLVAAGAARLWRTRRAPDAIFNAAKQLAVAGLALNLLQWLVAFIAVGGEWFLMWQSRTWNGSDTAGRMFLIAGIVLLYVSARDESLTERVR
jgi:predicted small integral membrane protein